MWNLDKFNLLIHKKEFNTETKKESEEQETTKQTSLSITEAATTILLSKKTKQKTCHKAQEQQKDSKCE